MEMVKTIINSFEFQTIIKLLLGIFLAGIIGLERSSWSKPAGFRTHALVGISAVLVMICGEYMSKSFGVDSSRIPAQLLSGIGFLGAGTILRDGFKRTNYSLNITCSYLYWFVYRGRVLFMWNNSNCISLYNFVLFIFDIRQN